MWDQNIATLWSPWKQNIARLHWIGVHQPVWPVLKPFGRMGKVGHFGAFSLLAARSFPYLPPGCSTTRLVMRTSGRLWWWAWAFWPCSFFGFIVIGEGTIEYWDRPDCDGVMKIDSYEWVCMETNLILVSSSSLDETATLNQGDTTKRSQCGSEPYTKSLMAPNALLKEFLPGTYLLTIDKIYFPIIYIIETKDC